MPPPLLVDISGVNLDRTQHGPDFIRQFNAHRFEFEMLDGIIHLDEPNRWALGYKNANATDFWVRGHIPGRPLFPGVLMIESAGQLCSVVYKKCMAPDPRVFLGFAGVDDVKFRGTVQPGERFVSLVKAKEARHRRVTFDAQGFVGERLVFEGLIVGMPV
jgi:3-hydroxyacyl-[acyl-carrier-protein] dehydratase